MLSHSDAERSSPPEEHISHNVIQPQLHSAADSSAVIIENPLHNSLQSTSQHLTHMIDLFYRRQHARALFLSIFSPLHFVIDGICDRHIAGTWQVSLLPLALSCLLQADRLVTEECILGGKTHKYILHNFLYQKKKSLNSASHICPVQ